MGVNQQLSVRAFCHALHTHSLEAALALLNQGVPHRYTAAYQVDGAVVRQVAVFDKAGRLFPEAYVNVPFELSSRNTSRETARSGHKIRRKIVDWPGIPTGASSLRTRVWQSMAMRVRSSAPCATSTSIRLRSPKVSSR